MRILELPSKLRARGLTVREVGGWEDRGYEFPSRPDGAVRHWDAISSKHPTAGLNVITNGRSDLPGPLAQVYQSRHVDENGLDIVYVVASGKANHAGKGKWNGISGNYNLLGLEIAWSGPSEHFDESRILTSELVMRALLDCCAGTNTDDACEHREYAQPAGRKIDTNLDGNVLRRRMAELGKPAPKPEPPTIAKDRLRAGEKLLHGQSIKSANGCYKLVHQGDGNLVMYMGPQQRPDTAIWHTHTYRKESTYLVMQGDGNLVLYGEGGALWHSHTYGNPGAYAIMQDDGNLVIYGGHTALWASRGV